MERPRTVADRTTGFELGMEQYFRKTGSTRLRINALAVNAPAQASYERAGFLPYEILYEKVIGDEGGA